MQRPIRLQLMGAFDLQIDGDRIVQFPRKAKAMLAYLALDGGHAPSREVIGDLLWPNSAPAQMRDSLRQALFVVRRKLDPAGDRLDLHDGIPLITPDFVDCDAWHIPANDELKSIDWLRSVDAAYSGPLLKNFPPISEGFDEWLGIARAGLEERALQALGRLVDTALDTAQLAEAVRLSERMMSIDPLREDTHRRLLTALAKDGRRSDALQQFASIRDLLERELQIDPSPETSALAAQIRGEREARPPAQLTPLARSGAPVLAVLPFQQLGPDVVPRHLSNGLVADIIAQLTGLHELGVISHGSTSNFQDGGVEPREVGRRLRANYVVRGTLRFDGSNVRLTKELVEAESNSVIWSHIDDMRGIPSFAEQDRIVSQLVNTLTPRVQEAELRRIRGRRPLNLTSYEKTLLAREHLEKRERREFLQARDILKEVIAEEPTYAEAHALAADCFGLIVGEGWSSDRDADVAQVETHSRTALELDHDNVRALVFYGHRRSLHHRDFEAAKAMFRRALELAPNSALAMRWSSFTYAYEGNGDEALTRAWRAMELSPCDRDAGNFYFALCIAYFTVGDFQQAAEWGRRAMAERPVLRGMIGWAAAALAAAGCLDEAGEIAAQTMAVWPDRRVRDVVAKHPYREPERRKQYGEYLLAAGFPK